jgi:hypothetical protein
LCIKKINSSTNIINQKQNRRTLTKRFLDYSIAFARFKVFQKIHRNYCFSLGEHHRARMSNEILKQISLSLMALDLWMYRDSWSWFRPVSVFASLDLGYRLDMAL